MTMDWGKITTDLEKKLNPENVQPPPKGKYGEYIFAWHAISEANRIFGFGGWSYSISLQKVAESKNDKGNHVIGYICKCTLSVGGVTREDIGYGEGINRNLGDAHEGATKEAASDSLKRALRTFGNPFGLALYDKKKSNVGEPVLSPDQVSEIQSLAEQARVSDDDVCKKVGVAHLAEIPASMFDGLKKGLTNKANEREES